MPEQLTSAFPSIPHTEGLDVMSGRLQQAVAQIEPAALARKCSSFGEDVLELYERTLRAESEGTAALLLGYLDHWWATLQSQLDYLRYRAASDARPRRLRSEIYRALRDVSRWPRMLAERCDADLRRRRPQDAAGVWLATLRESCEAQPTLTASVDVGVFAPSPRDGTWVALRKAVARRRLDALSEGQRTVPLRLLALHYVVPAALEAALDQNNRVGAMRVQFWRQMFGVAVEAQDCLEHLAHVVDEGRPIAWELVLEQLAGSVAQVREDTRRFADEIRQRGLALLTRALLLHFEGARRAGTFVLPLRRYDGFPSAEEQAQTMQRVIAHLDGWTRLSSATTAALCVQLDAGAFVGAVRYAHLRDSDALDALFEERLICPAQTILTEARSRVQQLDALPQGEGIETVTQLAADGTTFALHFLVENECLRQVSAETTRQMFEDRIKELRRSVGRASQKVAVGFSVVLPRETPLQEGLRPPNPPQHEIPMRAMADSLVMSQVSANVEQSSRLLTQTLDKADELLRDILRAVDFNFEAAVEELRLEHADAERARQASRDFVRAGLERVIEKSTRLLALGEQRRDETLAALEDTLASSIRDFVRRIRDLSPEADVSVPSDSTARSTSVSVAAGRGGSRAQTVDGATLSMEQLTEEMRLASFSRFARSGLPESYRRLFISDDRDDALFDVGLERDLSGFERAMEAWERGDVESVALVGLRGVGKSSIFKQLRARGAADYPYMRVRVGQRVQDELGLARLLAQELNLPEPSSLEALQERIVDRQDRLVVYVEGGERLFLRHPAGLGGIRGLMSLIHATDERILWMVSFEEAAFAFLQRVLHLSEAFTTVVQAGNLSRADLEQFILLRHDISGLRLTTPESLDGSQSESERLKRYFDQLMTVTRGYPPHAVYAWLESLRVGDDPRDLVLSPPQGLHGDLLASVDGLRSAALACVLLHGGISLDEFATSLRLPRGDAASLLGQLRHAHLVEGAQNSPRGFTVNRVAYQQIHRELSLRNLL
jgi:hypothetical protein